MKPLRRLMLSAALLGASQAALAASCPQNMVGDYSFEQNGTAALRIRLRGSDVQIWRREAGKDWELAKDVHPQSVPDKTYDQFPTSKMPECLLGIAEGALVRLAPDAQVAVSSATGRGMEKYQPKSQTIIYQMSGFAAGVVELYPVKPTKR